MPETLMFEAGELDFEQWCDLVDAAHDMLASTAIGSEFLAAAGVAAERW